MLPLTNTRSPGLAPARRTMVPSGTLPNIAIEIVIGPGVRSVSPPNKGQPNSTASPRKPSANPANHSLPASFGSASDNKNPSGLAPLAARSDKFTRSALPATDCAASSAKKCTPPTMASAVSTRSQPGGGLMKAASSDKAERARVGGDRREVPRDQTIFGRTIVLCGHDITRQIRPRAAGAPADRARR